MTRFRVTKTVPLKDGVKGEQTLPNTLIAAKEDFDRMVAQGQPGDVVERYALVEVLQDRVLIPEPTPTTTKGTKS